MSVRHFEKLICKNLVRIFNYNRAPALPAVFLKTQLQDSDICLQKLRTF